jgi:hypothetical protein
MTFGQPRVGNAVFASYFAEYVPNTIRLVHAHDIVPHLPPYFSFLSKLTYHHFPREVYLEHKFLAYQLSLTFISVLCVLLYSNYMYFRSNLRSGSTTLKTTQPNRYVIPAGKTQTAAGFTAQTFLAAQLCVSLAPISNILPLIIFLGAFPY